MIDVSRETIERLGHYENLMAKWNTKINLVSPSTMPQFASRHIDDSAQVLEHLGEIRGHWVDLGSGGGLPGLVIAIMTQNLVLNLTLVESDSRKCAFLQTVIRELSLHNVVVISNRIEAIPKLDADYISARALAPLSDILAMISKHMREDGTAILLKGKTWKSECIEARRNWRFSLSSFQSRTDPEAAILRITGVSHA